MSDKDRAKEFEEYMSDFREQVLANYRFFKDPAIGSNEVAAILALACVVKESTFPLGELFDLVDEVKKANAITDAEQSLLPKGFRH